MLIFNVMSRGLNACCIKLKFSFSFSFSFSVVRGRRELLKALRNGCDLFFFIYMFLLAAGEMRMCGPRTDVCIASYHS